MIQDMINNIADAILSGSNYKALNPDDCYTEPSRMIYKISHVKIDGPDVVLYNYITKDNSNNNSKYIGNVTMYNEIARIPKHEIKELLNKLYDTEA